MERENEKLPVELMLNILHFALLEDGPTKNRKEDKQEYSNDTIDDSQNDTIDFTADENLNFEFFMSKEYRKFIQKVGKLESLKLVSKKWKDLCQLDSLYTPIIVALTARTEISLAVLYGSSPLSLPSLSPSIPSQLQSSIPSISSPRTSPSPSSPNQILPFGPVKLLPGFLSNCSYAAAKELYKLVSKNLLSCPLVEKGLEASSQDHPTQSIDATLSNNPFDFWSSTGSSEKNSNEHLVFKLHDISLVHFITLKPFLAQYQRGLPCYAPISVSFSIGFMRDNQIVYHYTSPKYHTSNTPIEQTCLLPALVPGEYVRIDLYGKVGDQPGDQLYYTCLESVSIQGVPLLLLTEKRCSTLAQALVKFEKDTSHQRRGKSFEQLQCFKEDSLQAGMCIDLFKSKKCGNAIDDMVMRGFTSFLRRNPFLSQFMACLIDPNVKIDPLNPWKSLRETDALECAHWFKYYISILLDSRQRLTRDESLYLAHVSIVDGNVRLLEHALQIGGLDCTYELGLVLQNHEPFLYMAYHVYVNGRVFDKILETSILLGNLRMGVEIFLSVYDPAELNEFVMDLVRNYPLPKIVPFLLCLSRYFCSYSSIHF